MMTSPKKTVLVVLLVAVLIVGAISLALATETEINPKEVTIYTRSNLSLNVDGTRVQSDVEPIIYQDRVLIPARHLAEALGAAVNWNNETSTVNVDSQNTGEGPSLDREGRTWRLRATDPVFIGGYGDNFAYDGQGVRAAEGGQVELLLDDETNTGSVVGTVTGTFSPEKDTTLTGTFKFVYNTFAPNPQLDGGVWADVTLHGDTGREAPVLPAVRNAVATWGPVDIYFRQQNADEFELLYENLAGHTMVTQQTRRQDGSVPNADGSGNYSPQRPADGSVAQPDQRIVHLVAHTTVPDDGNFPPNTVWFHINFTDVNYLVAPLGAWR